MQLSRIGFVTLAFAGWIGCGAGPYGFARYYAPLADEEVFDKDGEELAYDAVTTEPDDYQDKLIAWFGVVEKITANADGTQRVRLAHRQHQERHLCKTESDDSCRVTVHFKSSGGFSADLRITAEDLQPSLDKVQPGSLLRVFGKVRCQVNDDEQTVCDYDDQGGILLTGVYYRQWPARHFVTTRAASEMRR